MRITTAILLSWYLSILLVITITNGKIPPSKIIGGEPALIAQYSHQVSIQINNVHICGGTIISKSHILTAASCVSSEISNDIVALYANIKIVSGTSNLVENNPHERRKINKIAYIIYHEQYNTRDFFINDIAIIKLTRPFIFDWAHGKALLSLSRGHQVDVYMTGWGNILTGLITENLQYLDVNSMVRSKCQPRYLRLPKLFPTQYCLFPKLPKTFITKGNGGSAIMKRLKIVGVLSVICSKPNYPAIYTWVYEYTQWINKNIQSNI